MSEKNVMFEMEEKKTKAEIISFLRSLAEQIEAGKIKFENMEEEIPIPEQMELEVKIERKDKKDKQEISVEVELQWRL
ncbi:amphi-Trp domain-containing protein [Thermodesulfovibrio hydrogeniphilus]